MLAELAAANAAFAVIKEAVANSGELLAAGQKLYEYFDAKSAIQRKYEEKAKGSKASDLEEFMALEQLKNQEAELKRMMIYYGRAGLWTDWLRFQSQAKRKREEAKKQELAAAARRKDAIVQGALWTFAAALLGVLIGIGFWLLFIVKGRG
jgi:hypothetical protein